MVDELDIIRHVAADFTPSDETVAFARDRLAEAMAAEGASRRRRPTFRLALILGPVLIAGSAIATIALGWFPNPVRQAEGTRSVVGTPAFLRGVSADAFTWSAYGYQVENGLSCLEVVLTEAAELVGSIRGCDPASASSEFSYVVGGFETTPGYKQVLFGAASEAVVAVRATSEDGQEYEDRPQSGVWMVIPNTSSTTWTIRALDASGALIASAKVTDGDNPSALSRSGGGGTHG